MGSKIRMGRLTDLPPGRVLDKRILARRIMVVNDGGEFYALEGDCKHMKASLAGGRIHEGTVTCLMHGWKYDLKTGACLTDSAFRLKTYPVEIENGEIFVVIEHG